MLLPDLTALARWIGRSDPADTMEQAAILPRLLEMRDAVGRRARGTGTVGYLDAAAVLTESMTREGGRPQEVRDIVMRLMSMTEKVLREDEAAHAEVDVPLTKDMVLGEVLVQMGVVTGDDVARALQVQATEGICIGEALIRIHAATQEDIDLGVQMRQELQEVERRKAEEAEVRKSAQADSGAPPAPAGEAQDREDAAKGEKNTARLELSLGSERALEETPGLALSDPASASPGAPVETTGDRLLGQILIQLGIVEEAQIQTALQVQRATGVRIGEALVEIGAASWDGVQKGVRVQGRIRHASGFGLH